MAEGRSVLERRRSPLARYWGSAACAAISEPGVEVRELPFAGVLLLQCASGEEAFVERVREVAGVRPPREPNRRSGRSPACLWVAPGEWLLITPRGEDEGMAERLRSQLERRRLAGLHAVTVITDARVVLRVAGVHAASLLNKGCGLDLDPAVFGFGNCAVSRLEQVGVTIYAEAAESDYVIIVERSHAAFAFEWLAHAAKEFRFEP